MFKVLVTGGRSFIDRNVVFETLNDVHRTTPIDLLIHGGCEGVDLLADAWAVENQVARQVFNIESPNPGQDQVEALNSQMLEQAPNLVIRFPGGLGTANCAQLADQRRIKVHEVM